MSIWIKLNLKNLLAVAGIVFLGAFPRALPSLQDPQGMTSENAQKVGVDQHHRPLTAGGTIKNGPIVFENVAAKAGLTAWRNITGTRAKRIIIEAKEVSRIKEDRLTGMNRTRQFPDSFAMPPQWQFTMAGNHCWEFHRRNEVY